MIVKSDKFNCYVEGIRVPLNSFTVLGKRNSVLTLEANVPIASTLVPIMWANAFLQITYLSERKEKLLFNGLCSELNIMEDAGLIGITATSVWDCLNFNTTLDYISPKKYGLQNLDEGLRVWVGTESTTTLSLGELSTESPLSNRFFYLNRDDVEIETLDINDPETNKLEYVLNKTPFAERFAFTLFEDILYQNYTLTRSYIDRFNLLSKTKSKAKIDEYAFMESLTREFITSVPLDPSRFAVRNTGTRIPGSDVTDIPVPINIPSGLSSKEIDALPEDFKQKAISVVRSGEKKFSKLDPRVKLLWFELYNRFGSRGLYVTDTFRDPGVNYGETGSRHKSGLSLDINGPGDEGPLLDEVAAYLARKFGYKVPSNGSYQYGGQTVGASKPELLWRSSGHYDHLHVSVSRN